MRRMIHTYTDPAAPKSAAVARAQPSVRGYGGIADSVPTCTLRDMTRACKPKQDMDWARSIVCRKWPKTT